MKRSELFKIREIIEKASASLEDTDALDAVELFPLSAVGVAYSVGERVQYDGKLYKVIQAHTVQADWIPGVGTESLYAVIDEGHAGTLDDPIPYDGNMELFEGMYYIQNGVTYRCTRNSEQPVYHALSDLVGLYVEVA